MSIPKIAMANISWWILFLDEVLIFSTNLDIKFVQIGKQKTNLQLFFLYSVVLSELPKLNQAPYVEEIDEYSVQVTFSAWSGTNDLFVVKEYRLEYKTQNLKWTIYDRIDPVLGENNFNILVENIKV